MLRHDPSPLNPANWATALAALSNVTALIVTDTVERIEDPARWQTLRDNAPGTALFAVFGILALLRGRVWTERLTERLQRRAVTRGRVAVAFLVSLLQMIVPLMGVIVLIAALVGTGVIGPQLSRLLEAAGGLAVAVYVARWLGGRLFREDDDTALSLLREDPSRAAGARRILVFRRYRVLEIEQRDICLARDRLFHLARAVAGSEQPAAHPGLVRDPFIHRSVLFSLPR